MNTPPAPSPHHQKSEGVQYATREEHGAVTEENEASGPKRKRCSAVRVSGSVKTNRSLSKRQEVVKGQGSPGVLQSVGSRLGMTERLNKNKY